MTGTLFGGGYIAPPIVVPEPKAPVISPIPFYIGLGAIASFINRDPCLCGGDDISDHRYGGIIRAGYDYNNYIGLEARALKTFGNNTFSEVTHYGLYAKPQYHINDAINVYGLIGYGRTTVDYTNGLRSSTLEKDGFSYGIGMEYDLSSDENLGEYDRPFDGQGDQEKGWGLWVDFQHLLSGEGMTHTDLNIVTVGITYDF